MSQKEFEIIAAQLRQQALTHARTMGVDATDADDVAQDVMLKLWAIHSDLRDAVHAYSMTRIAVRHLVIDSFRHKRIVSGIVVTMDGRQNSDGACWQAPDTGTPSPHRQMENDEDEQWLKERIDNLPCREMQVMTMRATEQKSNGEIARILGISPASVATMLSSARKKIFEDLKKRNGQ